MYSTKYLIVLDVYNYQCIKPNHFVMINHYYRYHSNTHQHDGQERYIYISTYEDTPEFMRGHFKRFWARAATLFYRKKASLTHDKITRLPRC